MEPETFWRWSKLSDYLYFLAGLGMAGGMLAYFFRNTPPFATALGYLSMLTEAGLAVPQVRKNWQRKSVEGVSGFMILGWVIGGEFSASHVCLWG